MLRLMIRRAWKYLALETNTRIAQLVEHRSPKPKVLGSNPNARDRICSQAGQGNGLQNRHRGFDSHQVLLYAATGVKVTLLPVEQAF